MNLGLNNLRQHWDNMLRMPRAVTFCMITAGKRPSVTTAALRCLQKQDSCAAVTNIILCGNTEPFRYLNIDEIPAPDLAAKGLLGAMRNLAGQASAGDVLVFLDDDVFLERQFVSRLLNYSSQHPWQVLAVKLLEADGTVLQDHKLAPDDPRHVLTGAFGAIRREVFVDHRWDPTIPFYAKGLHEDEEFSQRLHAAGLSIDYDPDNRAFHWNKRHGPGDFCPEMCRLLSSFHLRPEGSCQYTTG